MIYKIQFKRKAIKELQKLPKHEAERIIEKISVLQNNLIGDVKKLTNFTPEYRLRVEDYRVLFEIENDRIIIYHIKRRGEAYQ
jgi:mRNA interferase RelE/StbE